MKYGKMLEGKFLSRPNRFIAHVEIDGQREVCHVKNTGRCRELLIPGARVYVEESKNPNRKTKYDLISIYKGDSLVNMDSQAPNQAAFEWLSAGGLGFIPDLLKKEVTYGDSRFDIYFETGNKRAFMEIKGVTLEREGAAMFPDAPTLRGLKHVNELIKAKQAGYEAYILFVIKIDGIQYFTPNCQAQPEFAGVLQNARTAGVEILAYDCRITRDSLTIRNKIPVVVAEKDM